MAAAAVTQAHADIATLNARRAKERTPEPTVVVIFGASGDLTKRKLLPALFHLEQAGLLPQQFAVVGVARRPLGDSFAQDMREGITEFGGVKDGDGEAGRVHAQGELPPDELRRPGWLRGVEANCSGRSTRSTARRATGCSTWQWLRSISQRSWSSWANTRWRSRSRGRCTASSRSRSDMTWSRRAS